MGGRNDGEGLRVQGARAGGGHPVSKGVGPEMEGRSRRKG